MKILTHWIRSKDRDSYSRRNLSDSSAMHPAHCWKSSSNNWLTHWWISHYSFSSKEEVMKCVDQYLIDDGYKLLTEEQMNKLKVLK